MEAWRGSEMAKLPAYRLYSGGLATAHASNDLQDLIRIARLHSEIFGKVYTVKDTYGNVVWEDDE